VSKNLDPDHDRTGTLCTQCKVGKYFERSLHDDWEGTLHCISCNHCVERWIEDEE